MSLSLDVGFFVGVCHIVIAHPLDTEDEMKLEVQGGRLHEGGQASEGGVHYPNVFLKFCHPTTRMCMACSCHATRNLILP